MKKTQVLAPLGHGALALLLLFFGAQARAAASDSSSWFQSRTQALFDAVTSGDKAVWDQTLDAACIVTTEDGEVFDKTRMLADIRPLPSGFSGQIKVRGLTVREVGSGAVVHYWLDETEVIFGQHLATTYVETDTYRHTGADWKAVAMQVTVVPRDLEAIQTDKSGWPSLLGDYSFSAEATSRYRVFLRDGVLYGGRDEKSATRLIPLAPLVFFQAGSIHVMVFVQDSSGVISEVRELHKYNEVRMKRMVTAP